MIDNQAHLDLLYFEPYIPNYLDREVFQFLRSELPFYRVEYRIKRHGTETDIRTPRYVSWSILNLLMLIYFVVDIPQYLDLMKLHVLMNLEKLLMQKHMQKLRTSRATSNTHHGLFQNAWTILEFRQRQQPAASSIFA